MTKNDFISRRSQESWIPPAAIAASKSELSTRLPRELATKCSKFKRLAGSSIGTTYQLINNRSVVDSSFGSMWGDASAGKVDSPLVGDFRVVSSGEWDPAGSIQLDVGFYTAADGSQKHTQLVLEEKQPGQWEVTKVGFFNAKKQDGTTVKDFKGFSAEPGNKGFEEKLEANGLPSSAELIKTGLKKLEQATHAGKVESNSSFTNYARSVTSNTNNWIALS